MKLDQLPEGVPEEELLEIYLQAAEISLGRLRETLDGCATGEVGGLEEAHRLCHSMKGAARQFGFEQVSELAYAMERRLVLCREGGQGWSDEDLRRIREGLDLLQEVVLRVRRRQPLPDPGDLCARIAEPTS